jgi:hypothetical protein
LREKGRAAFSYRATIGCSTSTSHLPPTTGSASRATSNGWAGSPTDWTAKKNPQGIHLPMPISAQASASPKPRL